MIKVEVCKCSEPFNNFFVKDELYLLFPSRKNGDITAYVNSSQGFPIKPSGFVTTNCPYYQLYFEVVEGVYVRNYKEVNFLKKKPTEDVLTMIKVSNEQENKKSDA